MSIPAQVKFAIDLTEQEYDLIRRFRMSSTDSQRRALAALSPDSAFGSVTQLISDAEQLRNSLSPEELRALTDSPDSPFPPLD